MSQDPQVKIINDNEEEKNKGNDKIEKWLEELESSRESSKPWIRMKDGDVKVLTFSKDRAVPVERDFNKDGNKTKMMQFTVIDHTDNDKVKTIDFTGGWTRTIWTLLKEGYTKLKVTRTGEGTKTTYQFIPVKS